MKKIQWKPLQAGAILLWLAWLCQRGTSGERSAFVMPYLLAGVAGLYGLWTEKSVPVGLTPWENRWLLGGAAVFSAGVMFANCTLAPGMAAACLYFLGGAGAAYGALRFLLGRAREGFRPQAGTWSPAKVFGLSLAAIGGLYSAIFLLGYFPGMLTLDSVAQVGQTVTGQYNNLHPYYHTQIIRFWCFVGKALFGSLNVGVGLYSLFQIWLLAASFAYVLVTMYQKRVPKIWILLCLCWYALMPYHVMYSFTMWKDVLWGASAAAFLTALYRLFFGLGTKRRNVAVLILGGLGFCLMRTNGLLAFGSASVLILLFLGRKYPRLAALLPGIFVLAWVMNGPMLAFLGAGHSGLVEILSIPIQQVARVVAGEYPLTESQQALLGQLADLEQVRQSYKEYISDPVKGLLYASEPLLRQQGGDYLKLWLELGLRYPMVYLQAWAEQTKGYFNSGYDYWIWHFWESRVFYNEYGVAEQIVSPAVRSLWESYINSFWQPGLCVFLSIGFHVWLAAACFVLNAARRRWEAAFLAVPLLVIVFWLILGTPVFAEFRYAYPVFTCLPLVLLSVFDEKKTREVEPHGQ